MDLGGCQRGSREKYLARYCPRSPPFSLWCFSGVGGTNGELWCPVHTHRTLLTAGNENTKDFSDARIYIGFAPFFCQYSIVYIRTIERDGFGQLHIYTHLSSPTFVYHFLTLFRCLDIFLSFSLEILALTLSIVIFIDWIPCRARTPRNQTVH